YRTDHTALSPGPATISSGVDSALQLSATCPAGAATGSLTVTTPACTSAGLTLSVLPTITSFAPSSGAAGTVVTISGNTFGGVTKIAFGSPTTTASITPVSSTQIKATVPAGA